MMIATRHGKRAMPIWIGAASGLLLIIAGCAVGPDFKKPNAPKVSGYTAAPPTATE